MDSATLLYQLRHEGDELFCVNFFYGSKHNEREREHAAALCRSLGLPYQEIDLGFFTAVIRSNLLTTGGDIPRAGYDKATMAQTVVPGRNGIFMSILAGYAESIGADRIAIANHAGDHFLYPDCRPEWIAAMGLTIFLGSDQKVRLHAPFSHLSKAEICRLGGTLHVPFAATWSCYQGGEKHCGECGTCRERKLAFSAAGLVDPTVYEKN
jgi:7-cyano-7-deazaguanine synthase